eukprot:758142-Rhodomonas_salina.1
MKAREGRQRDGGCEREERRGEESGEEREGEGGTERVRGVLSCIGFRGVGQLTWWRDAEASFCTKGRHWVSSGHRLALA